MADKQTKRQLAVERDRNKVTLEITCQDHYAAMLLYEEVVESAETGELTLVLELTNGL